MQKQNTATPQTEATETADINSVVMANITMKHGSISKKCKATEYEIASGKQADQKKLSVSYRYLDHESISHARKLLSTLSIDINKISLSCPSMQGARYVKALDMDIINELVDVCEAELHEAKTVMQSKWAEIVEQGRISMAQLGLDNEIEWPTAEEFASSLSVNLQWLDTPAPVKDTVLETVSDEAASRARTSKASESMYVAAHAAPVKDLVVQLAKAAKATSDSTQKGKRLKQNNFDNLDKALDKVSSFNWLDLPELKDLVRDIKASIGVVDGPSLPRDERVVVAEKLEQAKANAVSTLDSLGL